ncbi:hypothetical protein [Nocardioides sp. GY 10127]|uniref:hypothetical protein n=1 Tax=Nocardioides sp. GY 10127 TaxID=2569762 RepID=UPI0010A8E3CA|nr:hypothetical protein [Nocardioides sp. GY 10127]TIC79976.1 hypothetical protein E8D37_15160 [Nocardioides sp. GY 10127]
MSEPTDPSTPVADPAVLGLVDDATLEAGWLGGLVGTRAVPDTEAPAALASTTGSTVTAPPLTLVVTGGAGQVIGPLALLAKRGVHPAGLEVSLRDSGDPLGNARRVVAAVDSARAEGLVPDEMPVWVVMTPDEAGHGWLAAADEVTMSGLHLGLPTHAPGLLPSMVATWIDAALDRETPFRCTGGLDTALTGPERVGWLSLLAATTLAFDGAGGSEVTAALLSPDAEHLLGLEPHRARRWFRSFASARPEAVAQEAAGLGLLSLV